MFNLFYTGIYTFLVLFICNMIALVSVSQYRPNAKSIPFFYAFGVIFAIGVIVCTFGGFCYI